MSKFWQNGNIWKKMKKIQLLTFNLHPKGIGVDGKCGGTGIWALVEEEPEEVVGGFEAIFFFS